MIKKYGEVKKAGFITLWMALSHLWGKKGKAGYNYIYWYVFTMFRNILDEYTESLTGYFGALDLYGEISM